MASTSVDTTPRTVIRTWPDRRRTSSPVAFGSFGLKPAHRSVEPATTPQFGRRAVFGNPALGKHDDAIEIRQRREPVGNRKHGAPGQQRLQRMLDLHFGFGVER